LCRTYGEKIYLNGETFYNFPKPETLAVFQMRACPSALRLQGALYHQSGSGNQSGKLDLDLLEGGSMAEALSALKMLDGVGDKVANCIVLFGLSKLEAFPVDVWMKRILSSILIKL
jgi:N-glycosylase/DNA lyase